MPISNARSQAKIAWGPARATATANEKQADALDAAERISLLSQRMRQVLDAVAEGRLSKELAQPLGLSVRTVELHRARMLDRLGVRTAAEAVRLLTLARLSHAIVIIKSRTR